MVDRERHQDIGRDEQTGERARTDLVDEEQPGDDRERADQAAR